MSELFSKRIKDNLHVQEKRNFVPSPVKSFEGKTVQDICDKGWSAGLGT